MRKSKDYGSKRADFLFLLGLLVVIWAYGITFAHTILGKPVIVALILCLSGSVFLGLRQRKPWKKILIGALIFGVLAGFIFEFIQVSAGAYLMPPTATILPKVFGFLALDNVAGHTLMAIFTFTFYEHFVNREQHDEVSPHMPFALYPAIAVAVALVVVHYMHPSALLIPYSYAYVGLAAIVLPIALVTVRPQYARDLIMMVPYFFFAYLLFEIIAVRYGWWVYPAKHYIGRISLFGASFPFEELFFWMLFYAASLTSFYKIYLDWPVASKKKPSKVNSTVGI
jgi:hypothetical protein